MAHRIRVLQFFSILALFILSVCAPWNSAAAAQAPVSPQSSEHAPLEHEDPVAPILVTLVLIAVGAAIGGRGMKRLGQPAVLGELLVGMIFANVGFLLHEPVITILREDETMVHVVTRALEEDISIAEAARELLPDTPHSRQLVAILSGPDGPIAVSVHHFVDLVSRIAVIILLFLVGLETSVHEMRRVGLPSFLVAVVGVVTPFFLGFGVTSLLYPEAPLQMALFIGGILTATSVGITARVFRDLKQTHRTESRIILGAAVIDDVLGLLVLAVVSALAVYGTVSWLSLSWITMKAVLFLVGSIGVGVWLTPRMVRAVSRLDIENLALLFGLGLAFVLAWVSAKLGLATIVGAFAAGLILEDFFFKDLKQPHSLRDLLTPLESLIVPVFFVLMGMQVKFEAFADRKAILFAGVLTVVAIAGKLVAGFVCSPKLDRTSIGLGMMPRGEVGLIFASVGRGLGVVDDATFSAVVIMVMVTTLLTPPLLKISLERSARHAH
jgi:Kef-type K+ transport system membrane component KefB